MSVGVSERERERERERGELAEIKETFFAQRNTDGRTTK